MPTSFDNIKDLLFVINIQRSPTATAKQYYLQGLRATVDIDFAGGMMGGTLQASIYGVKLSTINALTIIRYAPGSIAGQVSDPGTYSSNWIKVYAIDGAQKTLVFTGNIVNAWGNFQNQPDCFLQITAHSTYQAQLTPIAPTSFEGSVSAGTLMTQLAGTMGFQPEINDADIPLVNPYLPGTGIDQANAVAQAAGIAWGVDSSNTLWTCSQFGSRPTVSVPLVSAATGLIGSPLGDGQGFITFQTLFNPSIKFWGLVQLQSAVNPHRLNGTWPVRSISYALSSQKPDGPWFQTIRVGYSISIQE